MYAEQLELIPITTGLDCLIEHDIEQYQKCAKLCQEQGYEDRACYLTSQANKLITRKQILDELNPISKWLHCKIQYIQEQHSRSKVIKQLKGTLNI